MDIREGDKSEVNSTSSTPKPAAGMEEQVKYCKNKFEFNKEWIVYLSTVYEGSYSPAGVIHRGTKKECDLIMKAFQCYGAHNIEMEEL